MYFIPSSLEVILAKEKSTTKQAVDQLCESHGEMNLKTSSLSNFKFVCDDHGETQVFNKDGNCVHFMFQFIPYFPNPQKPAT